MVGTTARAHPVAVFVLVTFAWTWIIDFALWATLGAQPTASNHDRWLSVLIVGIYGPSVGALVTSAFRGGWQVVGRLVRRLLPWRVSLIWCLIAFALPALIEGAGIALKFTRGPLGEELGWRGFALPTLQTRYRALTSSLIIGALWFAWHLPMVWMAGTYIGGPSVSAAQLGWFMIAIMSLSVLETWVVNHTGSNVGLALLFFPELSGDAVRSIVYLSAIPSVCCALLVSLIHRTPLTSDNRG